MLQIRVVAANDVDTVARELTDLAGTANVVVSAPTTVGDRIVTADVDTEAADDALDRLTGLGVAPDAIQLVRLVAVQPVARRGARRGWARRPTGPRGSRWSRRLGRAPVCWRATPRSWPSPA